METGTVILIVGVGLIGGIVGFAFGVAFCLWLGRTLQAGITPSGKTATPPLGVRRRIDPKTGLETGETPKHLRDGPLGTKIGAPLD